MQETDLQSIGQRQQEEPLFSNKGGDDPMDDLILTGMILEATVERTDYVADAALQTLSGTNDPYQEETSLDAMENDVNGNEDIKIAQMSRQSVLQGLSEALLRRSLTKVSL